MVLNACLTARHGRGLGAPFNEGVASAVLALTGVQAVIANQYSISDRTAISFSAAFYGQIAAGNGVDEALTEARLRLKQRTSEWATPVLFYLPGWQALRHGEGPAGKRRPDSPLPGPRPPRGAELRGLGRRHGHAQRRRPRSYAVLRRTANQGGGMVAGEGLPRTPEVSPGKVDERRPLLLDFAAHSSIAFAAGWLLEPKSGLDVRVRQRTGSEGEFEWSPKDGRGVEGPLWLDRPDLEVDPDAVDVALALSVSQPDVAEHVREFIHHQEVVRSDGSSTVSLRRRLGPARCRGERTLCAWLTPLLPRLRRRRPHERAGRVHFFCACPNALSFYLGQLASSLAESRPLRVPLPCSGVLRAVSEVDRAASLTW